MAIDKEIKKNVNDDWLNTFPQLSLYSQNKFFKIVGSFVMGIEAVNIPIIDGYQPHFVIYPLWKEDLKKCFNVPSVYTCLHDKQGFQISIEYNKHKSRFKTCIEEFNTKFPILKLEILTLSSLFAIIDDLFLDVLVKTNSAQQAKLFELKLFSAIYVDDKKQVQKVINDIQQAHKSWNMQMFEYFFGNYELWLESLQATIDKRESFLAQIEINKNDKKIAKLKSSELIQNKNFFHTFFSDI